jgi:hypothetical protein
MSTEQLAFSLLSRLHALVGPVAIAQCDLVACEDGVSTMAYIYAPDGECMPLVFDTPAYFDPLALQRALEGGGGTVH